MKVVSVIAEYNPFHNGHLHQLRTIRDTLQADYIVVVLSGNFAQRGIPTLTDKYTRTKMALENGADLVLELPVYFALGSAEYFAQGAVSLLDKLGIIDALHFGSECGDISSLKYYADILANETAAYQLQLQSYLKQGISYPAARSKALQDTCSATQTANNIQDPNNILGIEYIKALLQRHSSITPYTIKREGAGYNDTTLTTGIHASASAIRSCLASKSQPCELETLAEHLPINVITHLQKEPYYLFPNDLSQMLLHQLLTTQGHSLEEYWDVSKQLSDKIQKNLFAFTDFDDFCMLNKSKDITYNRISRSLCHILLQLKQDTAQALQDADYTQYARVLGFHPNGQTLLRSIKANASIPLITTLPAAKKQLDGLALTSLEADLYATQIYEAVKAQKYHLPMTNEFKRKING